MRTKLALFAALGALSLLAEGCGAGPEATLTTTPSARQTGVLYASCVRAHGVSNFPDSAVSVIDGQVEFDVPREIKSEAQFPAASRSCQGDLPAGVTSAKPSENIQEQLKFADCMRSHGIAGFPDPMREGGFDIPGNTSSAQFTAAETACEKQAPGPS